MLHESDLKSSFAEDAWDEIDKMVEWLMKRRRGEFERGSRKKIQIRSI